MAGVVEGLAPMERRLPPLGCLKGGRGEWVRRSVGWLSSSNYFLVGFPVLKRPPPELLFYYIRILWYVFLHGFVEPLGPFGLPFPILFIYFLVLCILINS